MSGSATLLAQGLVAGYRRGRRRHPIVSADHLSATAGELTLVVGRNGAGKSTLLRTLTGTLPALDGAIQLGGDMLDVLDRHERARRLAVVLTDHVDAGLLSVLDIIGFGRHPHTNWHGEFAAADRAAIHAAAAATGVEHLLDQRASELSDGQRQRVMLARALAQQPQVIVLDEPTAYLDLPGRIDLMQLLTSLAHDEQLAVVVSSHELDLLLDDADRVWVLHGGVADAGTVDECIANGSFAAAFPTLHIARDASGTISIGATEKC